MRLCILLTSLTILLSGCGGSGGIMSPRYSYSDSHDTTVTTTTAQTATQEQSHNKSTCVGLLVFASCNTTQSNVQTAPHAPTAPVVKQSDGAPSLGDIVMQFLTAGLITAAFLFFLWALRAIFGNGDAYD